ncbi:MAG: serine/threonine protein kinase [Mycolicibacterium mageritense]|nr:MAG: serine/threonine protein kinase [Mycolicibacterium mageritense]
MGADPDRSPASTQAGADADDVASERTFAPPCEASATPTHIAGYQVDEVLALGGTSAVYLVHNPTLPRREALKLLTPHPQRYPQMRAQFLHEVNITAGLEHPNIVRIFNRGETDDGQLWLTMEYVEGTDAEEALTSGRMHPQRALHVITEVAKALDYAHAHNVIHHDVKPSNVLLGKAPSGQPERVVLSDFGAALATQHGPAAPSEPLAATLAYAAPEVITGHPLDGRADIYSLGCTLFRLLSGTHPYDTDGGPPAAAQGHLWTPPPRLSDRLSWASPQLDDVIATALAKQPDQRWLSAGAFAAAVADAITAPPRPATPPVPPQPAGSAGEQSDSGAAQFIGLLPHTQPVNPHKRTLLIVTAAAAVVAAATAALTLTSQPDPAPQTAAAAPTSVTHPDSHNARWLTELLPAGYPDHACTPSDTSTEDRTVLTCDQNTDPGGPQAATYTLFSTPDALPAALQQVIDKTTVVTCPGRIQSPGPWRRNDTPSITRGTVVCGLRNGVARIIWTDTSENLLADVHTGAQSSPSLDALYAWWGTHS